MEELARLRLLQHWYTAANGSSSFVPPGRRVVSELGIRTLSGKGGTSCAGRVQDALRPPVWVS
jgi:hypothetical protein